MLSETTGERIARLRERRHLTQAQLSDATDNVVGEAWIAAAEKDRIKNPKRDMLEPIAKALEVPLGYLTAPLGWVPAEEAASGDWVLRMRGDPDLSDDAKDALEDLARQLREKSKRPERD